MKRISTPHSDENPELGENTVVDLIVDNEDIATADLYKSQKRLGVRPNENVVYYEETIPYVDHERD